MSRRLAGVSFIVISAILYITRFLAAAIWGGNFSSWSTENFTYLLGYVDQGLSTWSIAALIIGLLYLLWGEISEIKRSNSIGDKNKEN